MIVNRFLDPNNIEDVIQLKSILEEYLTGEKNKSKPVYVYEDQKFLIEWIEHKFKTTPIKDFVITGQFNNGYLEKIFVAYKLEVAWGISESYWPYWYVSLVYFRNREWKTPAESILTMEKLAVDHFEDQKLSKGFMILKAPQGLIKMQDYSKADQYIEKVFTKTIPGIKHDFVIEHIFRTQADIDNYQFKALKTILPKRILSPIVLLSFNLKYEHRLGW